LDGKAVTASVHRWRAADVGDFTERGSAVGELAEQLESLLESRLLEEPRWVEAGAVTDGLVISLLAETSAEVRFEGQIWLLGGQHSWALPVAGTFVPTSDGASVRGVEVMLGDAAVGLQPIQDEPGQPPADWMFRFTWP